MKELKTIEAKYITMALELAGMGVRENEILERIENVKKTKALISESRDFRAALRVKRNNRIGIVK